MADGRLRLSVWKSAGPAPKPGRDFDVRLRIRECKLRAPAPLGGMDGLELEAFVSSGHATRVVVREVAWKRGPYATRDLRLAGELD